MSVYIHVFPELSRFHTKKPKVIDVWIFLLIYFNISYLLCRSCNIQTLQTLEKCFMPNVVAGNFHKNNSVTFSFNPYQYRFKNIS